MTAADPCERHRAQVTHLIDSVELSHSEMQLDDVCRINEAALTVEERIQWAGWLHARAGELRRHSRVQAICGLLGGFAAALAWLFTAMADLSTARGQFTQVLLLTAGITLSGTAVLTELDMVHHAGYQPWPVRFRLARKAREWVNLQPLRDSVDDELTCGHRADEARLVIVARAIATAITSSAIWRSNYLDTQDLRCDVQLDLVRIARGAVHLRNQRRDAARNLTYPPRSGVPVIGTEAWDALLTRLAWLHRYLLQLRLLPAGSMQAASTGSITSEMRFTIMALESLAADPEEN